MISWVRGMDQNGRVRGRDAPLLRPRLAFWSCAGYWRYLDNQRLAYIYTTPRKYTQLSSKLLDYQGEEKVSFVKRKRCQVPRDHVHHMDGLYGGELLASTCTYVFSISETRGESTAARPKTLTYPPLKCIINMSISNLLVFKASISHSLVLKATSIRKASAAIDIWYICV